MPQIGLNVATQTDTAERPQARGAEPQAGLATVLRELLKEADLYGPPAATALTHLLTFGERLPLEHALDSLNVFDEAVFRYLQRVPSVRLAPASQELFDGFVCSVSVSTLGRFHIRPRTAMPPEYHPSVALLPIASLRMDDAAAAAAMAWESDADATERALRHRIDDWLLGVESAGGMPDVIDAVDDSVRHVEAVCFYVDDQLLCNMEGLSTLVDKAGEPGILTTLRNRSAVDWTPAHRLAVAALRLLFLSGRSVRFEEFNGKVLTAARLFALFERLTNAYTPIGEIAHRDDLGTWASEIGRLARESPGKPLLRYRWIGGVTYFKTERITAVPSPAQVDAAVPDWARRWYERHCGRDIPQRWRDVFTSLADDAIARTLDGEGVDAALGPATTPLEALIQQIVWSAAVATDAHYSMSSSLRQPGVLLVDDEKARADVMLSLKPPDFYCCIASRLSLRALFGDRIDSHVYRAVQNRMQFNRWHFIAGNYTGVPEDRHYFYPPLLPDLAEWSDLRHAGHARASVRYSVRCPAPDMHNPPLVIGGHPYRGFYDVRVVRISGSPFTLTDLQRARYHVLWMGAVWERMVDAVHRGRRDLRIKGFSAGLGYEPSPDSLSPAATSRVRQ